MTKVRVKIDGLTREEDIELVADSGADAAGFIIGFPESCRSLSYDRVRDLLSHVPPLLSTVIVIRVEYVEELLRSLDPRHPSALQLYGSSHHNVKLEGVSLIKVVYANQSTAMEEVTEAARRFDAVLVDSVVKGRHGGTGITHDWSLSRKIRDAIYPKPLILAGGLSPYNVEEAIAMVKPYGVDVSSGVESEPGIKDVDKVEEFVRRAKSIDI